MNYFRQIIFFSLLLLCTSEVFGQCPVICLPTAKTCGNDARLDGDNGFDANGFRKIWSLDMCNICNFDGPTTNVTKSTYPDDWQLMFFEGFDGPLDKNYWAYYLPWGNGSPGANEVVDPSLSVSGGGTLKQQNQYAPGSYPSVWANGGSTGGPNINANYKVPAVSAYYEIPINCRVQARIRIMGDCQENWPAFWLFGPNDREIDIFEFVDGSGANYDDSYPNNWHKMTYHQSLYGYNNYKNGGTQVTHSIGVDHSDPNASPGLDFSLNYHTFEVIWDKYKIQWWEDGNIVYEDYVYWKAKKTWSNCYRRNHFRESPIKKASDLDLSDNSVKYMVNRYALDGSSYAMKAIISAGTSPKIQSNPNPGFVPSTMETDWFSFWIRAECSSGVNTVSNLDWYNYGPNSGSAYATGYDVKTSGNITIPTTKWVIFAATNEIEFNPGFSVNQDGVFSAYLTACDGSWDQRVISGTDSPPPSEGDSLVADPTGRQGDNNDNFQINEGDSIVYFNTLNAFDETNPFTELKNYEDHISLKAFHEVIKGVEIYNMQGQKVYSDNNLDAEEVNVYKDVTWSTGIYIIRVYSSKSLHAHRVWIR